MAWVGGADCQTNTSILERWEAVLSTLQGRMTEQRFVTWFRPLVPLGVDEECLTLQVPNPFFIDWFEEHNLPILRQAVHEAWGWSPEDHLHGPGGLQGAVPEGAGEDRASTPRHPDTIDFALTKF